MASPAVKLSSGYSMPVVGLGTYDDLKVCCPLFRLGTYDDLKVWRPLFPYLHCVRSVGPPELAAGEYKEYSQPS